MGRLWKFPKEADFGWAEGNHSESCTISEGRLRKELHHRSHASSSLQARGARLSASPSWQCRLRGSLAQHSSGVSASRSRRSERINPEDAVEALGSAVLRSSPCRNHPAADRHLVHVSAAGFLQLAAFHYPPCFPRLLLFPRVLSPDSALLDCDDYRALDPYRLSAYSSPLRTLLAPRGVPHADRRPR